MLSMFLAIYLKYKVMVNSGKIVASRTGMHRMADPFSEPFLEAEIKHTQGLIYMVNLHKLSAISTDSLRTGQ